jgi:hypothetical protein
MLMLMWFCDVGVRPPKMVDCCRVDMDGLSVLKYEGT